MYLVSIRVGNGFAYFRCRDVLEDKMFPRNVVLVGLLDPVSTKVGLMKNVESWSFSKELIGDVIRGELEEPVPEVPSQEVDSSNSAVATEPAPETTKT